MNKKKLGPYEFKDGKIIRRKEESAPLTHSRMFIDSLIKEEDEADNAEALENAKANFDRRRARDITARVSTVFIITSILSLNTFISKIRVLIYISINLKKRYSDLKL
jgi:hypothetical protein